MGIQKILRIGRGSSQSNEMKSTAIPEALLTVVRSLTSSCLSTFILPTLLQKTCQTTIVRRPQNITILHGSSMKLNTYERLSFLGCALSFFSVWHYPAPSPTFRGRILTLCRICSQRHGSTARRQCANAGPLVIACLWHCWLISSWSQQQTMAQNTWMILGNALQKLLFKKVFDHLWPTSSPWTCPLSQGLFSTNGHCEVMVTCRDYRFRIVKSPPKSQTVSSWETLGLVRKGPWFLQSRRARMLHHACDVLESYRFWGSLIVLQCSVRNHFRPTRLIIACFDRAHV